MPSIVLALPIFPGSHPPSIVGANELNFCVRDGNRWTLAAINTNDSFTGYPANDFIILCFPDLSSTFFQALPHPYYGIMARKKKW